MFALLARSTKRHLRRLIQVRSLAGAGGLASAGLMSGLVVLLTLPVITRLYPPDQYAGYALALAISSLLATVVSGRYEMACVVAPQDAKGDREAWKVARLALLVSLVCCSLLQMSLASLVFVPRLRDLTGVDPVWLFLPILVLLSAVQAIQTLLDTRLGRFALISMITVVRSVVLASLQIISGLLGPSEIGLILALAASMLPSCIRLCYLLARKQPGTCPRSYSELARTYRRFPQYQIWAALANNLSLSVFIFFLAYTYGGVVVAIFAVASRIVLFPTTIITGPVNTVYLRQAAQLVDNPAAGFRSYRNLSFTLSGVGTAVYAVLAAIVPWIAGVLGPEWSGVSGYIYATVPMGLALFVSSLANSTLIVHARQPQLLAWRLVLVIAGPAILLIGVRIGAGAVLAVAVASIALLLGSAAFALWSTSVFRSSTEGSAPRASLRGDTS